MSDDVEIQAEDSAVSNEEVKENSQQKNDSFPAEKEDKSDDLVKKMRELRNENKERRLENQKILSEIESLKKQNSSISAQANERIINSELKIAASKYKLKDFNEIKQLIDKSNISINKDGEVVGAEDAVLGLKERMPYLFDLPTTSSPGGTPMRAINMPTKSPLEMSRAEYQEAKRKMIRGK